MGNGFARYPIRKKGHPQNVDAVDAFKLIIQFHFRFIRELIEFQRLNGHIQSQILQCLEI